MQNKINILNKIVAEQMSQIKDPLVRSSLEEILIEPVQHFRKWDYGEINEELECWTIATEKFYDTSIVYSEFGFGPKCPWGLVTASDNYFGMDSGWFKSLKECFLDSFMAGDLPIWFIEKRTNQNDNEIVGENLTMDKAFKIIGTLTENNKEYHVLVRKEKFL